MVSCAFPNLQELEHTLMLSVVPLASTIRELGNGSGEKIV